MKQKSFNTQGLNKNPDTREKDLTSLRNDAGEDHGQQDKITALNDALEYAESIIDTVREPMLVLDGELRIKTASRSFYSKFKVSREDTEEKFIYDIGNGQWNIPELKILLEDILPNQNAFENFEVSHDFPDLGRRVMLLNARKIWRRQNHTTRVLLAFEDITDRKHAENELLRSNEDLQSFAYVAAHDMRNPLGAALNISKFLSDRLESKLDSKEKEMFSFAISSMEHLNQLLTDILSFSEVSNSQKEQTLVPFNEALQIALTNLNEQINKDSAIITVNSLPDIHCDRTLTTLVLQNLIGNALKYKRELPPRIFIDAIQENNVWVISIEDNGEGFSQDLAEKIFEPFRRVTASKEAGSGIGLATCKKIVERMGGKVWANSAPNQGSTFFFTIPANK